MKTSARPAHLVKIFRCKPTHMGFCNASVLGKRGVWLHPSRSGCNLVFCHPWPPDIIKDLVLLINPDDKITKSNLGIAALVLHEATLLVAVTTARMAVPRSGSDNIPTAPQTTSEASIINQVVADLLCIRALHSIFFLEPFRF